MPVIGDEMAPELVVIAKGMISQKDEQPENVLDVSAKWRTGDGPAMDTR